MPSPPCPHGRQRNHCKDCGGSSICEHGRQRSTCQDCGGSSICEHSRVRSQCKDCGGSSICEHSRKRSQCKDCGGSGICEHGRRRSTCNDCGNGRKQCPHGRRRNACKDCGGSSICEHSRIRRRCKECRAAKTASQATDQAAGAEGQVAEAQAEAEECTQCVVSGCGGRGYLQLGARCEAHLKLVNEDGKWRAATLSWPNEPGQGMPTLCILGRYPQQNTAEYVLRDAEKRLREDSASDHDQRPSKRQKRCSHLRNFPLPSPQPRAGC